MIKKLINEFVGLLPSGAPEFIYTVLLKPKPLRKCADAIICGLMGDTLLLPEGKLFLNKKDPAVSGALALGAYEPHETKLFREKVKEGMTVIDIGANIGYYTLIAHHNVGTNGRVISFEPDKENFALLSKTVQENGGMNVTLQNVALSNTKGSARLYLSDANKGDHRMYVCDEARPFIEVPTSLLDEYCQQNEIRNIDFIKMDVQGAEWMVLQGMKCILRESANVQLLTEFWPEGITKSGGNPLQYLNELQGVGLSIFSINKRTGVLDEVTDFELLVKTLSGRNYANLYCIKQITKSSSQDPELRTS